MTDSSQTALPRARFSAESAGTLFDFAAPARGIKTAGARRRYAEPQRPQYGYFQMQNRRYLGNKHKLLGFIEYIISEKCGAVGSLCDIFAGTGVVGERFNRPGMRIISNDLLSANYACLKAFLGVSADIQKAVDEKIAYLNSLPGDEDNYFSEHFGGAYFTRENAAKIGMIRDRIDHIAESEEEKNTLICALIYAADKAANTVGHYDAFRKTMDMRQPLRLLAPAVSYADNAGNSVYKEDANALVRKIRCDVLYIDPPYNSRQYCDAYHLLENLAEWKKPAVAGVGRKMDRSAIKSGYCLKNAAALFADLINNADCGHILLSYNNTGDTRDGRSNARMRDEQILDILRARCDVEIFTKKYKAFTAGRSREGDNAERVFYGRVRGRA